MSSSLINVPQVSSSRPARSESCVATRQWSAARVECCRQSSHDAIPLICGYPYEKRLFRRVATFRSRRMPSLIEPLLRHSAGGCSPVRRDLSRQHESPRVLSQHSWTSHGPFCSRRRTPRSAEWLAFVLSREVFNGIVAEQRADYVALIVSIGVRRMCAF